MPPSRSSSAPAERRVKLPVLGPVLYPRYKVSHSEMMRFRRCQWRWHLDYEHRMRSKIDSPALAFGDALHRTLEELLHREIEKRPSIDEAMYIFESKLSERMDKMPQWQVLGYIDVNDKGKETPVPPPNRAEMSGAAHRIMTDLLNAPELKRGSVVMNELKISEPIARLDDQVIKFNGFVDFVFTAPAPRGKKTLLYICDFKSTSWGWPVKKKREDFEAHSQILLYKHFVCKMLDLDPDDVRTVFILLKTKPRVLQNPPSVETSVEFFQISSGPKTMERAVEMLQQAVSGMASDELTLNRDECISKWDVCPYYQTDLCPSS